MKYIFTLLLAAVMWLTVSGQVNKAEYFIDADPGIGNGKPINIIPSSDVTAKFNVPLTAVTAGLHNLYVRIRDVNGRWSLTSSQSFFSDDLFAGGRTLQKAEYFIDTDPGIGKGTAVAIPAGQTQASVNFNVDLKKTAVGLHTLYVRVIDSKNTWSLTNQQAFYVNNNGIENIVALKYQFSRPGYTSATYTYNVPTPSPSIALDFKENLSDLVPDQQYTMAIYAVTVSGVQSLVTTKNFKVCSGNVAKAAFDIVQADYRVNFIADSGAVKYSWDFGDGKTDNIPTTLHTYTAVGTYKVKLIVSNFCNADTLVKTVTISGLKSISTSHGGNTGTVTLTVNGAGFGTGTQILIKNKGGQQAAGNNLLIQDNGTLSATFDFSKLSTGICDVIAIFPNNQADTLHNAFTVENGIAPKLSVSVSGDYILRIGFNQIYTITYSNFGNTDAGVVPLFIGGLPIGTDVEVRQPLFNPEITPGLDTANYSSIQIPQTINDTISGTSFRMLLINKIAAGSTGTIDVIFHVPETATLHSTSQLICSLGNPYSVYNPIAIRANTASSNNDSFLAEATKCLGSVDKAGLEAIIEQALPDEDITGIIPCFIVPYEQNILSYFFDSGPENTGVPRLMDENEKNYAVTNQILGCARFAGTVTATLAALLKKPAFVKLAVEFNERLLAYQQTLKSPTIASTALGTIGDCTGILKFAVKYIKSLLIGNAGDPNEKYGPGDASSQHYTNQQMINYVVNFENKPTSNLNAQTVTVIDTISNSYFNRSTFGFTSVTIGDSIFTFSPVKSFIHDFNFVPQYGVKARVVASFDTLTGIAQWKFFTIDPNTNQVTTNALTGFLPPDQVSPKGQGYVGYHVAPKAGVTTGDAIQNKAFITFDYNPVIPTNSWANTFDFVPPKSKMQPLALTTSDTTFTLSWGGSDNLSGVGQYNIYYSIGNSPYQSFLNGTTGTSAVFKAQKDSTYHFYSIAIDNAGNQEADKNSTETTTTVKLLKSQLITFPKIAAKTYGDPDFDPGATASSLLPVTYVSSNADVITVVSGKIHIAGAGSAIVTASQVGNNEYGAAVAKNDTLTVNKASQHLSFSTILEKDYKAADFAGGATSSSGLAVNYSTSNASVLTIVNGNIHIVSSGTATITANQPGNNNYLPSDTLTQAIRINFSLPSDNFKISIVGESCRNSNNGEIDITAASPQNYVATITSAGDSTKYPFSANLSVKNLLAGDYSVCIAVTDYPGYSQCFNVTITQPDDLSVYSVIDQTSGQLELHLTGGSSYRITLNGLNYTTPNSDITLPLIQGKNVLKVTTDNICQGIIDRVISLPLGVIAYPNPFSGILSLSITNDQSTIAKIGVYDINGKVMYSGSAAIELGKCSVDLSSLDIGFYVLKLTLDHSETLIKIQKNE